MEQHTMVSLENFGSFSKFYYIDDTMQQRKVN